jgi:uncharacterized protein YkwD
MRKVLAVLTVLAAALVLAPSPTASSAPPGGDQRAAHSQGDRSSMRLVSFRDRVIEITNNKRRNHGCRALRKNSALSLAAQRHTTRMANRGAGGTLSHQLPGEASFGVRIRRAGYNWNLVGENVANVYATPSAVVEAWMRSRFHRANILKCAFRDIGVGYATSSNGTAYWTQDFGRR